MKRAPSYTVLLFHSTDDRDLLSLKNIGNIHPDSLERLCVELKREYDVISAQELVESLDGETGPRGRFLAITFDDGPKSYASAAVPVMRSLGVPSTCFLITDCIGDKALYWRYLYNFCVNDGRGKELAALVSAGYGGPSEEAGLISFTRRNYDSGKNKRIMEGIARHIVSEAEYREREGELFLSFDDIRELKDDPLVAFGIHTRSHPVMSGLTEGEIVDEISGSIAFYHDRIENEVPMFSVPFGRLYRDYDERTVLAALDAGVQSVFSAYGGCNGMDQPLYNLRRVPVHEGLLKDGMAGFIRSLAETEVDPEYLAAEKRLREVVEQRRL